MSASIRRVPRGRGGVRLGWMIIDMIVDVGVGYCVDRVAGQAGPPWVT